MQVLDEEGSNLFDIFVSPSIWELISAIHVIDEPVSNKRRKGWDSEPILILAKNKWLEFIFVTPSSINIFWDSL